MRLTKEGRQAKRIFEGARKEILLSSVSRGRVNPERVAKQLIQRGATPAGVENFLDSLVAWAFA